MTVRIYDMIATQITLNKRPNNVENIGHCVALNNEQNQYSIANYKRPLKKNQNE